MAVLPQAGLGNGLAGRLALGRQALRTWRTDRSDHAGAQRAASGAFLIRVASAAIAFLSQPLLARWLGTHEFGIYAYVWSCLTLVGGIIDFGLATSAQRFIPEYAERKSLPLLRGFLTGSRWFAVAAASAFAALAAVAIALLQGRIDRSVVVPLYLGCATLPFLALAIVQDGIARSFKWIWIALLPLYIVRPVAILVLIVAAFFAGFAATAVNVLIAVAIATAITALLHLWMLHRPIRSRIEPGPKSYAFRTWLATSLPITISSGFYFLLCFVDVLVLQVFRPAEEVGVYFAAQKMLALVAFVHFSISATVAHRFAEHHAAGDREHLARLFAQSIRWTFWPSLAGIIVLLLLGRPLLWLFGPDFVNGYLLICILSVGLLARAAVGPAERLLTMLGRQRVCVAVYAGAFAFNLAACLLLIPRFGSAGAAISVTAAFLIESGALFWLVRRELGAHVFAWGGARA